MCDSGKDDDIANSAAYTETMKAKMGTTLGYNHEDGMNYSPPLHRIIVGSCVQTPADVDTLKKEGVGIIFCLQEDADMAHFALDIAPIQKRAAELQISHVRMPIRDFNPLLLRQNLPTAVRRLASEMSARPTELAYIHCTAGLGRAPGVSLAYWFWVQGLCLDEAYAELYKVRRCHPQLGMIRSATLDLLGDGESSSVPTRISILRKDASCVDIAGLDVGWNSRLPLEKDASTGEFVLLRSLLPGSYQYKFVVDGEWMPSLDLPHVDDNGNINNVANVLPLAGSPAAERYERMMAEKGRPTEEEFQRLRTALMIPATS